MSVTSHLARIAVPALLALCGAALATAGTTALGAASHGYGAGRTAHSAEAPALAGRARDHGLRRLRRSRQQPDLGLNDNGARPGCA